MSAQDAHRTPNPWHLAGALATALLAVVVLGCMSLNFGGREVHCTGSPSGVVLGPGGVMQQEGKATLRPGELVTVYFPVPYSSPPNLEVTEASCLRSHVRVMTQEGGSFVVRNDDTAFDRTVHWTARGVTGQPPAAVVPVSPAAPPTLPAPKEALPPVPVPVTAPEK